MSSFKTAWVKACKGYEPPDLEAEIARLTVENKRLLAVVDVAVEAVENWKYEDDMAAWESMKKLHDILRTIGRGVYRE